MSRANYKFKNPRKLWQRRPRVRSVEVPGAKKFLKAAKYFCERAAVEGNLKTWDGKGIFVQRCVERAVRSFDAAARKGARK